LGAAANEQMLQNESLLMEMKMFLRARELGTE